MERIIHSFFPEILCELCSVQTMVFGAGQGDDGRTSCIQSFLTIGPQMVTGCDKKGMCLKGAVQWSSGQGGTGIPSWGSHGPLHGAGLWRIGRILKEAEAGGGGSRKGV